MTKISNHIIRFCAEECARQKSGELSVANMVDAWVFVMTLLTERWSIIELDIIKNIAELVEPEKNKHGFRITPVTFADGSKGFNANLIENTLSSLCLACTEVDSTLAPEEFYQEFETIHPFVDGNGRVGALLYNFLRGSLNYPKVPPHYISRNLK